MSERITMIWAQGTNGVIGRDGAMPWHLPEDLAHFKSATWGHPVIMGRSTWNSIPAAFRPFAGRTNIVLTSDAATAADVRAAGGVVVSSPADALTQAAQAEGGESVWVIGGGQVYAAFEPLATHAVVTVIDAQYDGDTHAPTLASGWELASSTPGTGTARAANGLGYRIDSWLHTEAGRGKDEHGE
ncbi:dihydrofolate reductase [Zhihengliuella flava]|uniref:Dihydrofolate reductase n=1 Tax=Zhihengliuella flava TaxID=1285193 RepID=A0A931D801_9MICC|nr:dihydrofolate reductase [Zhihengliuella flava]MBG6085345.1 dihydrofolate reductase [Zhihengliuella flava]